VTGMEAETNLTRKLQAVEHDRIELVQQAVEVLRSVQSGNQTLLTEALAGVVGFAYLLGVQMGIAPHRIDREVIAAFQDAPSVDNPRRDEMADIVRHLRGRI